MFIRDYIVTWVKKQLYEDHLGGRTIAKIRSSTFCSRVCALMFHYRARMLRELRTASLFVRLTNVAWILQLRFRWAHKLYGSNNKSLRNWNILLPFRYYSTECHYRFTKWWRRGNKERISDLWSCGIREGSRARRIDVIFSGSHNSNPGKYPVQNFCTGKSGKI